MQNMKKIIILNKKIKQSIYKRIKLKNSQKNVEKRKNQIKSQYTQKK